MSYSLDEIQESQKIFAYLLEHHELRETSEEDLYKQFTNSDAVQVLLRSQGEFSGVLIERYDDVIYLIPKEDNYFLGFSKTELRQQLCRSNSTDVDYFLSLFAIIVIILKFYDGSGNSSKIRDYIRFGDLQNSIAEYLRKGSARFLEDEQNKSGILFTAMSQSYESLRSDEKLTRKKTTKEGFLYAILKFLQDQNLIIYIEQDEIIKTTRKFDHFMDWHLLDRNNYDRIFSVLNKIDEDKDKNGDEEKDKNAANENKTDENKADKNNTAENSADFTESNEENVKS